MKYYEFNEPYYALIRAKDKVSACEMFETIIPSGHFKFIEKTRNEALNAFLIEESETGDLGELIRQFNENQDKDAILLIDRGLI